MTAYIGAIYMQNWNPLCLVSESNKQNPRDRTLDLPFFFRYKHIPSLKNLPSPAPNESLPYWFQGNFVASFVLNFCLREFLLSACMERHSCLMCSKYRTVPCSYMIVVCFQLSVMCFHYFELCSVHSV